jgi:hypothetical protein
MSRGATESLHAAPFGPVVVPRHLEWELEPGILPVNLGKQPPWEVLAQRRNFDCDGVALWTSVYVRLTSRALFLKSRLSIISIA